MGEEPPSVWTREFLQDLKFDNNRDLFDHLKIEALKSGFDIASRQPLAGLYGSFYCTRGGRVRRAKTSKCGCTFQFKSTTGSDGKVHIRIDETLELKHNHELVPALFAHRIVEKDTKNMINELHAVGVKPMQIKGYLEQKGNHFSTLQIQYVIRRAEIATFQTESEELIEFVNQEANALTRVFEREIEGRVHRFAVLTFTAEELDNLKRFGDVLFIDGTMANLRMRWEVLPITGVDEHRELVSCGIMYASVTNEEVLTWLLSELWRILEPLGILRTLVTDEDAAFAAAFDEMLRGVNDGTDQHVILRHVLCALHKQRNFTQKLQKCGLSHNLRVEALDLFRSVCYHTNNAYAEHCLQRLKELCPKLRKYIEKRIVGTLPQFARSYMTGVYTNGYNTTSPAESMNNLLKQGMTTLMSLRESRQHFNNMLANHKENCALRHIRRLVPVTQDGYMPVELYRQLGAKMALKLAKQTESADKIVTEQIEDPLYTHRAWHRDHEDISYRLSDADCECNTLSFLGIPCSHLIKHYMAQGKDFPVHLINERWRVAEMGEHQAHANVEPQVVDQGSDDDSLEALEQELVHGLEEEEEESDLPADQAISSKQCYLRMFHIGKNIASKACAHPETAARTTARLNALLEELLNLPPGGLPNDTTELVSGDNSSDEVVDVVDHIARPRGRPKRNRNAVDHGRREKGVTCRICENNHATEDCVAWERVCEVTRQFKDYDGSKRRCGICSEPGHNARTCPIRLEARQHYRNPDDE